MATTKDAGPRVSARAAAVLIGDQLGREVSAKQVRTVAREHLTAYQDEDYTPHAYSKADVLTLLDLFASRASRRASVKGTGPDGSVTPKDVAGTLGLSAADLKGKDADAPSA